MEEKKESIEENSEDIELKKIEQRLKYLSNLELDKEKCDFLFSNIQPELIDDLEDTDDEEAEQENEVYFYFSKKYDFIIFKI